MSCIDLPFVLYHVEPMWFGVIKEATPKGCHIISFKSVAERKPFQRKGIIR